MSFPPIYSLPPPVVFQGGSYCPWTDRYAAGSFAGELSVTNLPSALYILPRPKSVPASMHKVLSSVYSDATKLMVHFVQFGDCAAQFVNC